MHTDVIEMIKSLAPKVISYISCNPTTQARDCELLSDMYSVEYIQPVDMFPQTYHIETVA
jgi:23S rRNA (uracil1939-C5)-methyltransferase